jgi:threonine dehydrogenase-like Zn-dependent dehydrogenase
MIYSLPSGISNENAALIELLSIGFHASKRSQLQPEDDIVIWGAGKVGQAILYAAKTITKGKIFIADILPERLALAQKAFPDINTIDIRETDPIEYIYDHSNGKGVDIAFEAVGHFHEVPGRFNPVRSCIKAIRGGGKLCVLGLSDEPTPVLFKELIWKEARIISSRVSHGEFAESIAALEKGILDPSGMITGIMDLSQADEAFQLLEKAPEKHLKILLKVTS